MAPGSRPRQTVRGDEQWTYDATTRLEPWGTWVRKGSELSILTLRSSRGTVHRGEDSGWSDGRGGGLYFGCTRELIPAKDDVVGLGW